MQRYYADGEQLEVDECPPRDLPVYLADDADAAITQLVTERDDALIAHSKLAVRVKELEQDNARWISARDVWTAEMKAKDERIRELERALIRIDALIDSHSAMLPRLRRWAERFK